MSAGNGKGISELERAAEQTRDKVVRDIEQVGDRLSIDGLKKEAKMATMEVTERALRRAKQAAEHGLEQAAHSVGDAAKTVGEGAKTVGRAVKGELASNPVAYGLIAAGVGWIVFDKLRSEAPKALGAARTVEREGRELMQRSRIAAKTIDSPVALGATAFVVGTALGLLVPAARHRAEKLERQLMS